MFRVDPPPRRLIVQIRYLLVLAKLCQNISVMTSSCLSSSVGAFMLESCFVQQITNEGGKPLIP